MTNPTTRNRTAGPTGRRALTAAARAAAKRAERATGSVDAAAEHTEERPSGRTVLVKAPKDGWEDPPEPSVEPERDDDEEESPAVRRPPRPLVALLGVLLVAGLVALGVVGWQYQEGRQAQEARGEALAAARKTAPVVLSYDYRRLDRDFGRARGLLTGKFSDQYRKTTAGVVGPAAKKYHAVVRATVATASVVSASPDKVRVLLFVNQVTESTQVSGSRLDLNRVRMTMNHTADGWKVGAVDAL
ncbi:hypothetical protein [Streptomyces sp. NPDC056948]|uniref:hypothetical protein n=1 Tax=Streptomyces sp. NPDC056948 TaxID=3345975 RepID=UPI00363C4596